MSVDPKRTAVVLIEYQNDFTSEGGVLHERSPVMARPECSTTPGRWSSRSRGWRDVMHAPITFAPGYGELSDHPYGILKGVVDTPRSSRASGAPRSWMRSRRRRRHGRRGQARARHVRERRISTSSCAQGNRHVALGGFLTNCCVESTMRTATRKATRWSPSRTASPPRRPRSRRTRSGTTTRCSPR